jgi:hypothetical protein
LGVKAFAKLQKFLLLFSKRSASFASIPSAGSASGEAR